MVSLSSLRALLAREERATGLPLRWLVPLALLIHAVVAVVAVNPWHPDEHFQILEFAWARAGLAPLEALPWEWAARIRPTLQPTVALVLLEGLRAVGVTSPFPWMLLLRLGTLATAFFVLTWTCVRVGPTLGRSGRRALWLTAFLAWYAPLFLFRFSSENAAGLALVGAILVLEARTVARWRHDAAAGVLLGLAFVFRFQTAFASAALLAWLVMATAPRGFRRAMVVTAGAATVVAATTVLDAWFYREWGFTPWRYFQVNILEGVAGTFGTSPWYAYLLWTPLWMAPPLGLFLAGLVVAGVAARPRSPWSWALVAFLAGHSLVGHKELRFLFPVMGMVPVLVAYGVDRVWAAVARTGWMRPVVWSMAAQNVILLTLLTSPAIHRGREFDAHYLRWLWQHAEARSGEPVYVLQDEGSPYLIHGLEANAYRHPGVRGVAHVDGSGLPPAVPRNTPPERLLVLERGSHAPDMAGGRVLAPVYVAEAGYRRMARWLGAEHSGWLRWIEGVDGWTGSERARRVFPLEILAPREDGP